MSNYVVLGIHGKGVDVGAIPRIDSQGNAVLDANGIPIMDERNVARVRMYVNGEAIDEDFDLPRLPRTASESIELYEDMLLVAIKTRLDELAKGVLPAQSLVVKGQQDRAVVASQPLGKDVDQVIKDAGIVIAPMGVKV